jgi:hypothetical protein
MRICVFDYGCGFARVGRECIQFKRKEFGWERLMASDFFLG